jgi:hypothetical protein
MKNINEWQKLQKLNQISPDWVEWYNETKDTTMKSYREWKIQKNLEILLEDGEPPMQPGQLPPPDPSQPAGPPPPGGQPPAQQPPPEPEQPQGDDKVLVGQLQGILGQKIGSALMPAAIAMKEEAKKVKSLADQKQMNPADGLKMWLWTCINAWEKTVASQAQKQPPQALQVPQPPQAPQPPQPPPQAPQLPPQAPPQPGM